MVHVANIRKPTGATRAEGLQAMKVAAKTLRDKAKVVAKAERAAAKAATRGTISKDGPTGHYARIQYLEDSTVKVISGPCRRSERRAVQGGAGRSPVHI